MCIRDSCTYRNNPPVDSVVAFDTGAKSEQGCKTLPWTVLLDQFIFNNPVRFADNIDLLLGNLPNNPHCKSRAGKWHPVLDLFWQTECTCNFPYLIFVEIADRFNHFRKFHVKRHATDIMVTFDTPFTLDPVRVNSALQQAFRTIFPGPVSYTHLRAHETDSYLVCR